MEINITQKFVDLIYDLIGSLKGGGIDQIDIKDPVSYTHLRAHET